MNTNDTLISDNLFYLPEHYAKTPADVSPLAHILCYLHVVMQRQFLVLSDYAHRRHMFLESAGTFIPLLDS